MQDVTIGETNTNGHLLLDFLDPVIDRITVQLDSTSTHKDLDGTVGKLQKDESAKACVLSRKKVQKIFSAHAKERGN